MLARMWGNWNTHTVLMVKRFNLFWKPIWQLLKRLSIELPYHVPILLLGIYLREPKTYIHTKTCTLILTATLFIIGKKWGNLNDHQVTNG